MNEKLTKEYQCWTKSDYAYSLNEFDTIEQCFSYAQSIGTYSFYITKKVTVEIKDASL